jgi:hypothetical protein
MIALSIRRPLWPDLRLELADGLLQVLDHLQVLLEQEPMMSGNLAVQRGCAGALSRRGRMPDDDPGSQRDCSARDNRGDQGRREPL